MRAYGRASRPSPPPPERVIAEAIRRTSGGLDGRFWRLWIADAIANLGDGALWIALPLLAISLSDSPALVAGITAAARLPWLLFALFAGVLVDRVDRRRAMVVVDLARVALIVALIAATLAGVASIWL